MSKYTPTTERVRDTWTNAMSEAHHAAVRASFSDPWVGA